MNHHHSPPTQTAKQAATDLGVSVSTVYRWLKSGEIRKHGVTGHKVNNRWVITLIEDAPAADIDQQIRAAYTQLAGGPGVWVSLTQLRPLVDAPRATVDDALRRLERLPDVNLVPESNQKTLTMQDREAAVTVGDQAKHLLWIG